MEKCAKLIAKCGKRETREGMEFTNQKSYGNAWKERKLQEFGNIEIGHHQTNGDAKKKKKKKKNNTPEE